jgi:hypothetical protein
MGIHFGVSASSLADGTSIVVNNNKLGVSAENLADGTSVVANNNKFGTTSALNSGRFVLDNAYNQDNAFYTCPTLSSSSGAYYCGLASATPSLGSVYFTPKYSGNIFVAYTIMMGGTTATGDALVSSALTYGSGTPPAQGSIYIVDYETPIAGLPVGLAIAGNAPWSQNANSGSYLITGLTIGEQYWLDVLIGIFNGVQFSSDTTATLYNVVITWYEV